MTKYMSKWFKILFYFFVGLVVGLFFMLIATFFIDGINGYAFGSLEDLFQLMFGTEEKTENSIW